MVTTRELEAAAFWDQAICLDCEAFCTADDVPDDEDTVCPHCGSDAVYSAAFVLRVAGIIDDDE